MPHLIRITRDSGTLPDRFPFSVPAVRALHALDLAAPVTFFVGENGPRKSTLREANRYHFTSTDHT